jgi:hypothetical protein
MSDETDLDRDLRLAEALGRLPAPALPAGLAERIVRNATALPQDGAAPVEASPSAPSALGEARPAPSRRWLPYAAVGSAIAASLVAALFIQGPARSSRPEETRVAQNAPAVAPAPSTPAPDAPAIAPDERIVVATEPPVRTPAAHKASASPNRPAAPPSEAAQAPPPDAGSEAPAAGPAPALANQDEARTPTATPDQQALVGPPVPEDIDPAMRPSGPTPGLGITGGSAVPPPVSTSPAPQPHGRGPGGMPRF